MNTREKIEVAALALEGTNYFWTGNTPRDPGLDCSGFAQWVWKATGLLPDFPKRDRASQELFDQLEVTGVPQPGDACFYSSTPNGRISHVVLVISNNRIIGANGGDRPLETEFKDGKWTSEEAMHGYLKRMQTKGAGVNIKPSANFRKYLRGFRKAPTLSV